MAQELRAWLIDLFALAFSVEAVSRCFIDFSIGAAKRCVFLFANREIGVPRAFAWKS